MDREVKRVVVVYQCIVLLLSYALLSVDYLPASPSHNHRLVRIPHPWQEFVILLRLLIAVALVDYRGI